MGQRGGRRYRSRNEPGAGIFTKRKNLGEEGQRLDRDLDALFGEEVFLVEHPVDPLQLGHRNVVLKKTNEPECSYAGSP